MLYMATFFVVIYPTPEGVMVTQLTSEKKKATRMKFGSISQSFYFVAFFMYIYMYMSYTLHRISSINFFKMQFPNLLLQSLMLKIPKHELRLG